jgi:Peptidase family M23/LysM domain
VIHEVVSDETLSDIASNFGVSTADIMAVTANAITDANQLQRGQILLIPNPTQFSIDGGSGGGTVLPVGPTSATGFIWPTSGPITSYFGPGHPLGIDIGLYANPSSPIIAALPGTVVFAGGNACCSYGYYVVVDHANGFETLYAHLSEIDVSVGEQVSQGEVLGIAGTTGYSTGVHLHFEVHKNGSVVDPLQYLP